MLWTCHAPMISSARVRRFTQKDPKEPKRTQKEPKRTQKDPKGTQMEPKRTQMEPKRKEIYATYYPVFCFCLWYLKKFKIPMCQNKKKVCVKYICPCGNKWHFLFRPKYKHDTVVNVIHEFSLDLVPFQGHYKVCPSVLVAYNVTIDTGE